MNNNRVLAGLKACSFGKCSDCPYDGTPLCSDHMCDDALAMFDELMAAPTHIKVHCYTKPKYHTTYVFVKRTNLLDWFTVNHYGKYRTTEEYNRAKEYYSKERDIQLELHVRHEHGKCYALIQCPINPLPIKGEVQCILSGMISEIKSKGWNIVSTVDYIG